MRRMRLLALAGLGLVAAMRGQTESSSLGASLSNPSEPSPLNLFEAGGHHACATRANGTVLQCWGLNQKGQVGDGMGEDYFQASGSPSEWMGGSGNFVPFPVTIDIGGTVKQMSLGKYYSCAVLVSGALMCWGSNRDGQLGDGTTTDRYIPTRIQTMDQVDTVAAGVYHTCAVLKSGPLQCWGNNEFGQLGDGTTFAAARPRTVMLYEQVTQIALGAYHTCASLISGELKCWGANSRGQLGIGSVVDAARPQHVSLGGAVWRVGLGKYHSCAALASGEFQCWGFNIWGFNASEPLAEGWFAGTLYEPPDISTSPVHITDSVTMFSMGGFHTCLGTTAGNVKCFGKNNEGQCGDSTMTDRPWPVRAEIGGPASTLSLGSLFSCALRHSGDLFCWGGNDDGEMGSGTWLTPAEQCRNWGDSCHGGVPSPHATYRAAMGFVLWPKGAWHFGANGSEAHSISHARGHVVVNGNANAAAGS